MIDSWFVAEENLNKKGIYPTIIDARFAKPLDENLIWQIATNHESIISIEEGSIGGFGSHVSHYLSENKLLNGNLKFRSMILPDRFIDQDNLNLIIVKAPHKAGRSKLEPEWLGSNSL